MQGEEPRIDDVEGRGALAPLLALGCDGFRRGLLTCPERGGEGARGGFRTRAPSVGDEVYRRWFSTRNGFEGNSECNCDLSPPAVEKNHIVC